MCVALFAFVSCGTGKQSQESDTATDIPAQFTGKVLVNMMPENTIEELESDFSKYELKHQSIASRSQNQHLFNFNLDKISAEDLLKKLNKSKKVYSAEALSQQFQKATLMSSGEKKKVDIK